MVGAPDTVFLFRQKILLPAPRCLSVDVMGIQYPKYNDSNATAGFICLD